jgi:TonB-linked SusC/RagA family outer membrane protein
MKQIFIQLMLLLCCTSIAYAQKKVTGTVKASDNQPLIGVSVQAKGAHNGTATDAMGHFSLTVPAGSDSLIFRLIGYTEHHAGIGNGNDLSIIMQATATTMEDVVVVGYAAVKKATVTGAISTVKGADLVKAPVINVSQSMAGRLPGVTVRQTSGEPGRDGATILIRGVNTLGNNSPLVIVDGIPNRSLERIDPNTIESMTVLKDASAAIYGSQAANGVILITTKRGQTGKPQLQVDFNQAFTRPTVVPKMATAAEHATLLNELDTYAGRAPRYTDEDIAKFADGSDPWRYPNTDWFDAVMKNWSGQNALNANLSGGNDRFRYFMSLNSRYEDAFYKNSNTKYRQYDFTTNLDGKISDHVSLSVNFTGRASDRHLPTVSTDFLYRVLYAASPIKPAFWPNGAPGPDLNDGVNPAVVTTGATGSNDEKQYTFNSNVKLNIEVPWVKGLTLTGIASYDHVFTFDKLFQHPWEVNSWDGVTYDANKNPVLTPAMVGMSDANLNQSSSNGKNSLLSGIVNYEKSFGPHNIRLLAGMEAIEGKTSNFSAYRRYYISSVLQELFAGGDQDKNNNGSSYESARLNYFGRVNYSFAEKYLFEFLWRYDGSYIFPEENRFGFFPGVSAGWVMSEEPFWKDNLRFANFFKLRGSWGKTGNDRIDEWQYISTYGYNSTPFILDETEQVKRLYETRIPNPNVTWEVANQSNIGFESFFLNNSLSVNFDYFYNKRSNILWYRNATVPGSSGITLPRENIGKVQNSGIELSIGYQNHIKDFRYQVTANASYARSKILFWDEPGGRPEWQKATGKPIPSSTSLDADLYYDVIGVFRDQAAVDAYPHWTGATPGDLIFRDVDGNGEIDANDMIRIDKTEIPRWTGGMTISLGYRQFDFSLLLQGAMGGVRYDFAESGEVGNFYQSFYDERWTPGNPAAAGPKAYNRWGSYWTANRHTYFLNKSDYLRLKNLELGYRLPQTLMDRIKIQGIRLYVSGYNLLTYCPGLKHFDPESPYTGTTSIPYPIQKVINAGVNVTF